jgi:hypothetical protein
LPAITNASLFFLSSRSASRATSRRGSVLGASTCWQEKLILLNPCALTLDEFEGSDRPTHRQARRGVKWRTAGGCCLFRRSHINVSDVVLAPGQNPDKSGVIGNLPPLGELPEPSSISMMFGAAASSAILCSC